MAEIRIQNVSKHFGKVIANQDINLTIHDREFMVLLGPSGCGKTTLLRGHCRITTPLIVVRSG